MSQVSRYPISEEAFDRCWEIFTRTLIGIKTSKDVEEIIGDLLTPTERIMVAKRLAIAYLLSQGYEYRQISKVLRVSFPTISMVNIGLKYGRNGYRKAVGRIQKDENLKELLNKTIQVLIAPGTVGKGSGTWRYLRNELQKKSRDQKPF